MADTHDKLYDILLDVQKQLGKVSRETGEQTQKLIGIDNKQTELTGYQKYANSKISSAMKEIEGIKIQLSDYDEVRKNANNTFTWRKGIAMMTGILVIFSGVVIYAAKAYIEEVASNFLADNGASVEISPWK